MRVGIAVLLVLVLACQEEPASVNQAQTHSSLRTAPDVPSSPSLPSLGNPDQVLIPVGSDIQQFVDEYPAGTQFVLGAGTHLHQSVRPKVGNVFVGEEGAVLDGGSETQYAFEGDATDVTISGLIIQNYATPPQRGAVDSSGPGWKLIGNEIRFNAGAGAALDSRFELDGNFIHNNQQIGVLARGAEGRVTNNEIAENNPDEAYEMDWEAGGAKFLFTTNLYVAGNYVHDNGGVGLWTDNGNYLTTYEHNTVIDNKGPGILHEISYDAVIRDNVVEGNAHEFFIGGILISSSSNVEIYGNALRGNHGGIVAVQDDRDSGDRGLFVVDNLLVHDNTVSFSSGWNGLRVNSGARADESGTNSFLDNTYEIDSLSRPFRWGSRRLAFEKWSELGFDSPSPSPGDQS